MPTGVAGRWLVTLLGAIASGAAVAACTGSQIDERTAVRVNVQRGAATTVEELAIPVGGRADDAFGSVTGYRIEDAPDEVSSSFITDLSSLPDAVELTESVGLRFVSALSSPGTDAIVIALAFAPSEEDRVSMLADALLEGVSGGTPTEIISVAGEPAVLIEGEDSTTGEQFQMVFWQGEDISLLLVGLINDRDGLQEMADAFVSANHPTA
jgi:hypothetical protein